MEPGILRLAGDGAEDQQEKWSHCIQGMFKSNVGQSDLSIYKERKVGKERIQAFRGYGVDGPTPQ